MKKATLVSLLLLGSTVATADVTRHPLPGGSTFPIAQAVEVSAGTTWSGLVADLFSPSKK